MSSEASLLLVNGRVLTLDPSVPQTEGIAIKGDRILGVGTTDDLLPIKGSHTRVLDLGGLTVVPGFNDCHMHILGLGITLLGADVSPDAGVTDIPSLLGALRGWVSRNPGAVWIRAYGYNQNVFPGARHVTAEELDAVFPDTPVIVFHTSGHAAVANSAALKAAAVDHNTPSPPGGEIVRDGRGRPTGLLLESAISAVTRVIPPLTVEERTEAIVRACARLVSVGVTSASDMGLGGPYLASDLAAYRRAVEQGAALRMTLYPEAAELWEPAQIPSREEIAHEWRLPYHPSPELPGCLRLGALKLFADGALTTRTAAVTEPFIDGSGTGMLLHEPEELEAFIRHGHRQGWQIATHAIGDRAINLVLSAYETVGADNGRMHRIEHAMMIDVSLAERMSRAGVAAVLQPEFLAKLGDAYVLALGETRASQLNPVGLLLQHGVNVAFSSDCPVVPGAPVDGIRAAMRRRTSSGRVLGPEQQCRVEEALTAYCTGAARVVRDPEVGCLRPGLRADLAILTGLPAADNSDNCRVVATVAGGQVVFGKEMVP